MKKKLQKKWMLSLRMLQMAGILMGILGVTLTLYCFFHASDQKMQLITLIQKDVGYNIYFMYAMIEILCSAEIFYIGKQLKKQEQVERCFLQVIIVMLVQSFLLNPITSIVLFIFLFQNMRGNSISLRMLFSSIKDTGSSGVLLANALGLLLLTSVVYMTLFSLVA